MIGKVALYGAEWPHRCWSLKIITVSAKIKTFVWRVV